MRLGRHANRLSQRSLFRSAHPLGALVPSFASQPLFQALKMNLWIGAAKPGDEDLADFWIATIQGAMLMGKIKRSNQTVETTVQEAVAHLKSYLLKRKRR